MRILVDDTELGGRLVVEAAQVGVKLNDAAKQVVRKLGPVPGLFTRSFQPHVLKGWELGQNESRSHGKILEYRRFKGLSEVPFNLSFSWLVQLREDEMKEWGVDWVVAMHDPVALPDGSSRLLARRRSTHPDRHEPQIYALPVFSEKEWGMRDGLLFAKQQPRV